ncbi:MAG: glycosyltransferase [Anaerolineae bacterium]|nr:glycosyltransferase [Anaerolineae bacterium]
MRILFVVPYTPNLIRVRPYNFIRALGERGHEVTVLTLATNESEWADSAALAAAGHEVVAQSMNRLRSLANCLIALPTGMPLQAVYSWHPGLARLTAGLAGNENGHRPYDVVHVEHLRGARYGLHLLEAAGEKCPPIVWDSVDCISHLFRQASEQSSTRSRRLMTRLELERTARYEAELIRRFDHVLVTSPVDRQALLDLPAAGELPAAPISVIRNGVDLDYFRPAPEPVREAATLVFSGKMSYHANVTMVHHLVQEILPRVWKQRPDARLLIVGKDPPRRIEGLAEARHRIDVTGTVPDIRPYLQRATASVVPLVYGAGVQNKVLEAMACATPVVAYEPAITPLSARAGHDLLVARDPNEFAAQIVSLLEEPERRRQIGWNGRAYVERHHDWDLITAGLEATYQTLASMRQALAV